MLTRQIALVSEHPGIAPAELASVGAALQKQATRDLAPIWEVAGTVDVFPTLDAVPVGYWPILITDRGLGDAAGIHLDPDAHPYALVHFSETWPLTASHECLEMLVDPSGNRTTAATSPDPDDPSGRVEILVEVCDPCEDARYGYTIDGILVSDFYTPAYLEPSGGGVRFSYNNMLGKPGEVLPNGYLSWRNPTTAAWYQTQYFGAEPQVKLLGQLSLSGKSAREAVNEVTPQHFDGMRAAPESPVFRRALARREAARSASVGRAKRLHDHIASRRTR